jgi:methionine synthase II (cobalamin-independent)
MTRSGSRILTTHVGSLIRPADLLQQSKAAKQSPQELARYEHTLRCATVNVVEQQINAGIDIVNDGEFGKPRWSKYVLDRLTGFELRTDSTFEQSGSVATGFASDNSWRTSFHAARPACRDTSAWRRSHCAVREAGWSRERDCRHRLRLRATRDVSTCAPAGDVGEVERAE